MRGNLSQATIGWHEELMHTPESRTKMGRYNTETGPARATRHFTVTKSQKQLRESSHLCMTVAIL